MSSTPKRFTRYDAEHHDPATEYVLASDHDAEVERLRTELSAAHRATDVALTLHRRARQDLAALSYPAYLHTNPLLTVEAGGIRYVLEVLSDEDGEWFEVKSATPTEPITLDDFASSADAFASTETDARKALAIYRAAQREDDEASRAY